MKNEVELKLSIDSKNVPRLLKHLAITHASIGKPTTHKLLSIYYDTPNLTLLDSGITLRVRHISGRWVQTIKATGGSSLGLHQRMEWEDMIASEHLDFTKILDPDLVKLFADQMIRDTLRPIFQTRLQRSEWQLAFDNGDRVELAIDLGQLAVDNKSESISEIELTLKAGHTGRLFDLALELQKAIPLMIEKSSIAQRGFAYLRNEPPVIFKAQKPNLAGNADAGSAFKKIAWKCINHLQCNEDMVFRGADVEGVHQMRIALRRLRSAFTLFRKVLGHENSAALLVEIGWLAETLGKARDLDVLITQTLPVVITQFKHHKGLQMLRDKAITAQSEAYSEVRAVLSSQRYQCLLLTLAAWLENERWQKNIRRAKNYQVIDIASTSLSKRYKRLLQRGKHLDQMNPEERHATRIAAKRLRYAAEFFASLYDSKKSRAFIKNLSQLQERLGVLNDITITENLLVKIVGLQPSPALDEARHILSGWNACSAIHYLTHMSDDWQIFTTKKPFWR